MASKKTATVYLSSVKDPDEFGRLIQELGLTERRAAKFFEFGEYATIELEVDQNLTIVGGRFLGR